LSNLGVAALGSCPDGKTLLFSWIGRGGNRVVNIYRTDANGANPVQITFGKVDLAPVCAPDSKHVYYVANTADILRVPLDGSSKPEVVPGTVIPGGIVGDFHFGASPGGKLLAFVSSATAPGGTSTVQRIALVPLDEGSQPHVRFLEANPQISDGPRFTPDGKALVYSVRSGGVDNLWLQPLDGSPGRQITNFPADTVMAFHWSPDGKTLGLLRMHSESDVILLRDSAASP